MSAGRKFVFQEKQISKMVGISRRELKKLRIKGLVQGGHWMLDSGAVFYSESGLKQLLSLLTLPFETLPPFLLKPQEGEKREMVVARIYRNTHLLGAELEGKLQRVRVQSNRNFKIGMHIPVEHIRDDVWKLIRRCPRWPGRW